MVVTQLEPDISGFRDMLSFNYGPIEMGCTSSFLGGFTTKTFSAGFHMCHPKLTNIPTLPGQLITAVEMQFHSPPIQNSTISLHLSFRHAGIASFRFIAEINLLLLLIDPIQPLLLP